MTTLSKVERLVLSNFLSDWDESLSYEEIFEAISDWDLDKITPLQAVEDLGGYLLSGLVEELIKDINKLIKD